MATDERDRDELDRLLSEARWAEPGAEQLERLSGQWRSLRQAQRRRRAYAALAMAASVLVVAGLAVWRILPSEPLQPITAERPPKAHEAPTPEPKPLPESPSPRAVANDEPPSAPVVVAQEEMTRDPSTYEQVALVGSFPRGAFQHRPRRRVRPREASLYELIAASGPGATAALQRELSSYRVDMARFERQLSDAARQGDEAALRLLARIATPRSVGTLLELAADPSTHATAMRGLARLASPAELARLAAIEPDARLQRELLAALLARRTYESLGLYLALVQAPRTRTVALETLAASEDPPVDMLLDYLESPQSSLRLAAARAASQLADPAVAERLCESLGGIGRQEALIALLLSHSTQAADCLRHARENIYLVAAVQAAERQLQTLQTERGGNLP